MDLSAIPVIGIQKSYVTNSSPIMAPRILESAIGDRFPTRRMLNFRRCQKWPTYRGSQGIHAGLSLILSNSRPFFQF